MRRRTSSSDATGTSSLRAGTHGRDGRWSTTRCSERSPPFWTGARRTISGCLTPCSIESSRGQDRLFSDAARNDLAMSGTALLARRSATFIREAELVSALHEGVTKLHAQVGYFMVHAQQEGRTLDHV